MPAMPANARLAYVDAAVSTASPQALLLMLCDRLVLDVQRAAAAADAGEIAPTHRHLVHAQAVVNELSSSLNPDAFRGGRELAALYRYLHSLLISANVGKDAGQIAEALSLSTEIARTWRDAAMVLSGAELAPAASA